MIEALGNPMDLTVQSLVSARDVSARLKNSLAANPSIGDLTAGQFLADSAEVLRSLRGIRNFGRKTAAELYALVSTVAGEPMSGCTAEKTQRHSPERIAFEALVGLLAQIPFPDAFLATHISTRLRNNLKRIADWQLTPGRWEADTADLGSLVQKWPEIRRELLHQANFGRGTLAELKAIIENTIGSTLAAYSPLKELPAIEMSNLSERQIGVRLRDILLNIDCKNDDVCTAQSPPDTLKFFLGLDSEARLLPRQHVLKVLSRLTEKEVVVITRRYGLQGSRPETLRTIAAQLHFTHEGIRQIETKALDQLRIQSSRQAFERLLDAEQDVVWNLLTSGSDLLTTIDLQQGVSKIPGEFLLAVKVVHDHLSNWVNTRGHAVFGGWLRETENSTNIEECLTRLAAWAAVAPGPLPIAAATEVIGVSADDLPSLLKLYKNIRVFEGYICSGQVGTQVRRTCRLHRLATGLGELRLFDVATLCRAYSSRHPGDHVFPRMIQRYMHRAPHLFLRMFDAIWVAIGSGSRATRDVTTQGIPFERAAPTGGPEFEPGSISEWLHSILSKNGPMRVVDIEMASRTALPQDVPQSSIGALLQLNAEFVRIAPGVFGL